MYNFQLPCISVYTSAFTSLVDVYPFTFLNETEAFSGKIVRLQLLWAIVTLRSYSASSSEFKALGEITPLIEAVKIVNKKLVQIITQTEIRNMFLTLSDLLSDMYPILFGDDVRFKTVSGPALESYLAILKAVKMKISGPYDSNFLSGCSPFFAHLLGGVNGKRSKLRAAAAELWNKTFAEAKSLDYPKELKFVIFKYLCWMSYIALPFRK
ncbi:unnamed protein product, partial [Strongylus vulgaris]